MNFYLSMCDDAIIGGGFNPKGAHNISEALVLGKPVLTGPHVKTIEYPFAEAETAGVASSVQDAAALAKALIRNQHPSALDIQSFIEDHSNATSRTLAAIPQLLKATRF
jgi:3-deoxy-D-manno-octulosonic-acid transferase